MQPRIPYGPGPQGQFGPNGVHDAVHPALFFAGHLVAWVLFILLIALACFLLYRLLSKSTASHHGPALHELEMRYARGEISRDDYIQRRSDLLAPHLPYQAPGPPPPSPPAAAPPPAAPPATTPPPSTPRKASPKTPG